LCAWQWYVQTLLHNEGQDLQKTIFKQGSDIQGYTNSIKNMDAEIAGLSTRVNELKHDAAMTNEQTALRTKARNPPPQTFQRNDEQRNRPIQRHRGQTGGQSSKRHPLGSTKQNEAIRLLVSERDDAIKKYNDSIKERNALAEKYNTWLSASTNCKPPPARIRPSRSEGRRPGQRYC
jgi:uncharacterized coiled-coil DUF342 family protein